MTKPFLVLSDLDHTLFQSLASDPSGIKPMSVDSSGQPHGFANPHQIEILDQATRDGTVIPVTARCHEKFERVNGLVTGEDFDLALTDLGANLLFRDNRAGADCNEWEVVESWRAEYFDKIQKHSKSLVSDYNSIIDRIDSSGDISGLVMGEVTTYAKTGIPFYMGFTISEGKALSTDAFVSYFIEPLIGSSSIYTPYIKDNVVCLWPRFVSKGLAVSRLLDIIENNPESLEIDPRFNLSTLSNRTIITMGDMTNDHDFMRQGHLMVIQTQSNMGRFIEDSIEKV